MQNIIPITDLQQKTKKYVDRVRTTGVPLVRTDDGTKERRRFLLSAEDFRSDTGNPGDEMSHPDSAGEACHGVQKGRKKGEGAITLEDYLKKAAAACGVFRVRTLLLSPEACRDLDLITESLRSEVLDRLQLLDTFILGAPLNLNFPGPRARSDG